MANQIDLWVEGFAVQGNQGTAQFLGTYEASNITEAVMQFMDENPDTEVELHRFGDHEHAIWGCRIFDNEKDARRSYG